MFIFALSVECVLKYESMKSDVTGTLARHDDDSK